MPIKPENRELYPDNWDDIRERILLRAQGRCEAVILEDGSPHPEGGAPEHRCDAHDGHWIVRAVGRPWLILHQSPDKEDCDYWIQRRLPMSSCSEEPRNYREPVKVVLTIAHLDHDPTNNEGWNLRALCQRCHNIYDAPHRARNAARTRREKIGQQTLLGEGSS